MNRKRKHRGPKWQSWGLNPGLSREPELPHIVQKRYSILSHFLTPASKQQYWDYRNKILDLSATSITDFIQFLFCYDFNY